jgi:hypothetical protein
MNVKTKRISTLIESQLPEFISTEYELFGKFVEKYYESQEVQGGTLDVINNIQKYLDIDFYEKNILKQNDSLASSITSSDRTITLNDASSFPTKNGYVRIGEEIIFYASRNDTQLLECSRGVSGNTTLGDLYNSSSFQSTIAEPHSVGDSVYNISNLFLYAFVRNFESQYLASFPEKYLKSDVDKRTLIKNIQKFYKAKGTDSSIRFIFNSIVAKDIENVPTTYNPSDFTLKASSSNWETSYSLKVKLISGDINNLIGNQIVQDDPVFGFASAIVDNVRGSGSADGETLYQIILNPSSVNGTFRVASRTKLQNSISSTLTAGGRVNVESTLGWNKSGSFFIKSERFLYDQKNAKQFYIKSRSSSISYAEGNEVLDYSPVVFEDVEIAVFGVLYDFNKKLNLPYSSPGDKIQRSDPGFTTRDRIITDPTTGSIRWRLNDINLPPTIQSNVGLQLQANNFIADVSAIYEDDQYYYICSSGYPSYGILSANVSATLDDPKNLKIIRKSPIETTEIYETPARDVGVFVDGSLAFGYKDEEFVKFGNIVKTTVTSKGSGYQNPPFVLINDVSGKAESFLSGETVGSISITNNETYEGDPEVTITSGRKAVVTANITSGKVTSLNIINPGEYYSSPPSVVITDSNGKGRFAEYEAIVSKEGQIVDFVRINPGRLYGAETVQVSIVPRGSGATATAEVRKWVKNRYKKTQSSLDVANGHVFDFGSKKQYGIVANPVKLRYLLGDNLSSSYQESSPKIHSKILGYAYDGNPIYGPFGYSDPGDPTSSIERIQSGYNLNLSRVGGPSTSQYPLGTFIDDYTWSKTKDTGKLRLDENNGRYCVTPDYPEGVYAYFISTNSSGSPTFPFIIGNSFYSLPIRSNYDSSITQDDIPTNSRRYNSNNISSNGYNSEAVIQTVTKGSISSAIVEDSSSIFSVGSELSLLSSGTGEDAAASVSKVFGRNVEAIESVQDKVVQLKTKSQIYFFEGDTITQENTGATGEIYGNSFNTDQVLLRTVSGDFSLTDRINSNTSVVNLIVDKQSEFTKGAVLSLFDGVDEIIATGEVLDSVTDQNSVKVKVLTGLFIIDEDYSIFSSVSSDTPAARIISIVSLSENVELFSKKENIALLKTEDNHNLDIDDLVDIEVVPDDSVTETTYYIRKKKYQILKLETPIYNSTIKDTGIGRIDTLVGGADYASSTFGGGTFSDVEILFSNQELSRNSIGQTVGAASDSIIGIEGGKNNAKATVVVGNTKIASSYNESINTITFDDLLGVFVGIDVRGENIAEGTRVLSVNTETNTIVLTNDNIDFPITGIVSSVVFNPGVVSSVTITSKGTDYRRGDTLSFKDSDLDKGSVPNSRDYLGIVDHVGFSRSNTDLFVSRTIGVSVDDLIQIGAEILKVVSVDDQNNKLSVLRGQNNTTATDHFNGTGIGFALPQYRFNVGSQLNGGDQGDPFIVSYDRETQTLVLSYNYGISNINQIQTNSLFVDNSSPSKRVGVNRVIKISNRFEYSKDNVNFSILKNLDLQRKYLYKFDTSHFSMANTYLEFSPSNNKNIVATDSFRSSVDPGNVGSFIKLKPGEDFIYFYGTTLENDNVIDDNGLVQSASQKVEYSRYFFFDKNNDVDSDGGFFNIVGDPLTGQKRVIFTTDTGFVYECSSIPQYDGSGSINYSTSNPSAIGKIKDIKIDNIGRDYDSIPSVVGVRLSSAYEATLDLSYDSVRNRITSVSILDGGSNYTNPKAIVIGNGSKARVDLFVKDGVIVSASLENGGENYTEKPIIKVVESSVKVYLQSKDIGLPERVKVENSGFLFNNDSTILRQYSSNIILILKDFSNNAFASGEKVIVKNNNIVYATGRVSKNGWKNGSNILKLVNVNGEFVKGLTIRGEARGNTATIVDIVTSEFTPNIKSYYDNIGSYTSDRGKLNANSQKITDSFFYQDFSYVIRSKTPIDVWRNLIKDTTHPAGFKLFGEVIVESFTENKVQNATSSNFTIINLEPKTVSKLSTKRTIKQSFVTIGDTKEEYGLGSVFVDNQNNAETLSTEIILSAPFDGEYDQDSGKVVGTKTFSLINKSTGFGITPYNEEQLLITLDGVIQEPVVSYTVSGSSITFAEAPLGPRFSEGQNVPAQSFYCKSFKFKSDTLNQEYLRKARNFFQRNGRWLDAANQIRFNKDFIAEEAIGYVIEKYPNVPWNVYRSKCIRDIRLIIDAYEHDLRFGGNFNSITSAESYYTGNILDHITNELTETLDAFKYTAKLCSAAARNWDYTVTNAVFVSASDIVTVPSSFGITVGMNVSSGTQLPEGTVVSEIINDTQVRLSNAARSGAGLSALVVGPTETVTITQDETYAGVLNAGDLNVGVDPVPVGAVTLTSVDSIQSIPQVTFSFSKINNGTFYDASNLIERNKTYIQEETLGWVKNQYPALIIPDETKCKRDTGYLVDAIVYSLRYGGTEKIINFAKSYYDGNTVKFINNELTESVDAFEYAIGLMVLSMRGELPAGTYTSEVPYYDSNIFIDPDEILPKCFEVESALNSYSGIIETLLLEGINLIQPEPENNQRVGNWTNLRTYSNYNIIPDPLLLDEECTDVESSLVSLYSGIETVISNGIGSITKTNPDYIDGKNKDFEIFYEDGSIIKTNESEDLLVFINGVLQLPGSYNIIRSADANISDVISFSSPPIWAQEENTITVQEPIALDKTFVVRVGSYEKLTINNKRIAIKGTGPYLMFDRETGSVRGIDNSSYAYVFIDGVLQKNESSYTINGNIITFTEPLRSFVLPDGSEVQQRVDILVFYGRDIEKELTFHNFEPDTYYNRISLRVDDSSEDKSTVTELSSFFKSLFPDRYPLVSSRNGAYLFTQNSNTGVISSIGKIIRIDTFADYFKVVLLGNNVGDLDPEGTYIISPNGRLDNPDLFNFTLGPNLTLTYNYFRSSSGLRKLARDESFKTKSLSNLRVNDLVKIDGESDYRRITSIPEFVHLKDFRGEKEVSNEIYGKVGATNYNGTTSGSGLGVRANIENGSVVSLDWNKRDIQLFVDNGIRDVETATGYYTAPILNFVPVNEFGGGARAEVLIIDRSVVDVIITNPGSGYTEPPRVVVSRRYKRIKENRKVDYLTIFSIVPRIDLNNLIVSTNVRETDFEGITAINSETRVGFENTFIDADGSENVITATIQIESEATVRSITKLEALVITPPTLTVYDSVIEINRFVDRKIDLGVNVTTSSYLQTAVKGSSFVGVVDKIYDGEYDENFYSQGILGNRLSTLESIKFVETGYSTVADVTIEEYTFLYPELTIEDFESAETLKVSPTKENRYLSGYPTINNYGIFIDPLIDFNIGDTILYVNITTLNDPNSVFPDQGELLVGDEIISYTSKMSDRFMGITRSLNGTIERDHAAGTFVRTF